MGVGSRLVNWMESRQNYAQSTKTEEWRRDKFLERKGEHTTEGDEDGAIGLEAQWKW